MQKSKNRKLIISIVLASVSLLAFLALMILVLCDYNFKLDSFNNVVANNRNSFWTGFFKVFTHLGSFYVLAILALIGLILLFFVFKKKRLAIFSGGCFAFVCIANYLLKIIVRRARPEHLMIIEESGFSFPSGHSMMTFAFFALLIYFAYIFIKNKPLKITLISIFSVIIVLIGFSRIYLGVHYLTDVLAGWLITFTVVVLFLILYNSKLFTRRGKDEKEIN